MQWNDAKRANMLYFLNLIKQLKLHSIVYLRWRGVARIYRIREYSERTSLILIGAIEIRVSMKR